ncbi:hypothetical protein B4U80_11071 [Leptotrombidium deliense]|uniref:Lariat debranching enzyme C-terminal domain-containing protein n=1 Tax=Leptotrombidium deliense TaxID=299467 RepID=A0A443SFD8_9ACAR|nr:hypothetical protein B4U80_11071 [Leptotrombidium deliense]
MKIAVAGCVHGKLDIIYEQILALQAKTGNSVDLLLVCGDVQTLRNENDLNCMAVKDKFKELGDFHKYYKGEKTVPVLTLFIGGNHEASNYLMTLPFGGWVCPNMYYMGYAGVVRFNGLRIAAISGIYNEYHKNWGHYESLPFDERSKRSIYHTRTLEVFRLMQLAISNEPIDIFVSHDWPLNIHSYGDVDKLLRIKPFFSNDIRKGSLGNPLCLKLLDQLKPSYWFSAHLHVRFEATVTHENKTTTQFLALDKCLPRRHYLEFIEIEPKNNQGSPGLNYDAEWLAILKNTDHLTSIEMHPKTKIPGFWNRLPVNIEDEIKKLQILFNNSFKIPDNFEEIAPIRNSVDEDPQRVLNFLNPQTTLLCNKLKITDPTELLIKCNEQGFSNPDEILLSDEEESNEQEPKKIKRNDNFVTEEQVFVIDKQGSSK